MLVQPVAGQVTGRDGAAHLHSKAMEVLLVLASNPGTLVTREALLEEVWGVDQGSQEALSHAVGEIRHALHDHADRPEFIQTLPKRGYRLIIEVRPTASHTDSVVIGTNSSLGVIENGLLENLKQRGVLETILAYLLLGWLIIQVADIVFSQLMFPVWTGTFVTALVIAGFPIAILLSWFLEFRDGRAVLHEQVRKDDVKKRFSRTYISVIGALAIAAVFVFIYDRNIGLPEATTTEMVESVNLPPVLENSIAVLPFLNLDGSEDTQVFSNGLTDDLITGLSRVPGLLVSSRGDAFTLAPNTASKKVRERLRVAIYLEGSVQIAGDKLRIIVQMIDSETGFHVMSRRFDRPRGDFFEIRNQITELTVANVRVSLPPDTQATYQSATADPSLDVYVLYRRGIDAWHAPISIDSINTALAWFDEALVIDPEYAAAHAGKCQVFVGAYPETDDSSYIEKASTACSRALSLNPNLDVVHTAMGDLYHAIGRYDDAETSYLDALRVNPKSVAALTGIGTNLMLQNSPERAEEYFRQAIGLHPGNWFAFNSLGGFFFYNGRYAEAAEEYEKVVALDSNNTVGYANLGTAYLFAGEFEVAASVLEKAIEIDPEADTYNSLGLMHYYLGNHGKAVESLEESVEIAPHDALNWSNLGDALWVAGKKEEAIQAFETAESIAASAVAVNPNNPNDLMDLAWINAMLDKPTESLSLIDRARLLAPDDPFAHYVYGLIMLRQGDSVAALEALNLAVDKGYSAKLMAAEPHLAALHGHPEFVEIIGPGGP
jgi:tetratricopeptide (TPR) repeat protein/TolB-like protein/DNA-binding winged helix-turn-helix (wHTH) protein